MDFLGNVGWAGTRKGREGSGRVKYVRVRCDRVC